MKLDKFALIVGAVSVGIDGAAEDLELPGDVDLPESSFRNDPITPMMTRIRSPAPIYPRQPVFFFRTARTWDRILPLC